MKLLVSENTNRSADNDRCAWTIFENEEDAVKWIKEKIESGFFEHGDGNGYSFFLVDYIEKNGQFYVPVRWEYKDEIKQKKNGFDLEPW